jgi:hypothetical protein
MLDVTRILSSSEGAGPVTGTIEMKIWVEFAGIDDALARRRQRSVWNFSHSAALLLMSGMVASGHKKEPDMRRAMRRRSDVVQLQQD